MEVRAESISCRRGDRLVLDRVSLAVAAGEILCVSGRNGAGKSTLLACLAGLLPLENGRVVATGLGDAALAERAHLVGHRDGHKAALTAAENLRFAQAMLGSPRRDPADALAMLGIAGTADLPVATLSAGQKRRLALARLLVSDRPVWLLDEPLAALDAAGQRVLGRLLADHLGAGGIAIAATHGPLPVATARMITLGDAGA